MRPKGEMDKTLFPLFIKYVILPCYPNVQKDTIHVESARKIKGPLIIKTDTGPGRLSKDEAHIWFWEELMKKGVHILLGLPNKTECTQEMDQGFTELKPACDKSTIQVAAKKMAACVAARKKMKAWQESAKQSAIS